MTGDIFSAREQTVRFHDGERRVHIRVKARWGTRRSRKRLANVVDGSVSDCGLVD